MFTKNIKLTNRKFEFTNDYIVYANQDKMKCIHDKKIIFEEKIIDINKRDELLKEISENISEKVYLLDEAKQFTLDDLTIEVKVFASGSWIKIFNNNLHEIDAFMLGEISGIKFDDDQRLIIKISNMLSKFIMTDEEIEKQAYKEIEQLWRFNA